VLEEDVLWALAMAVTPAAAPPKTAAARIGANILFLLNRLLIGYFSD
jgi:hypothetical protein